MVINHNISALNTLNKLNANTTAASNALEKLSSGMRINKAADDAAGLAISQKMQAQINGLDQASSNAQDGISLIQTAEGSLNETQSILQRMNTLATQSANDTNTSTDRAAMQQEVNQLTQEIDRIGNTTQFNTKNLLDGSATVSATASFGATESFYTVLGGTADTKVGANFTFGGFSLATAANSATSGVGATFASAQTALGGTGGAITLNGVKFQFTADNTVQDVLDAVNNDNIGIVASYDKTSGAIEFTSSNVGSAATFDASNATGALSGADTVNAGTDATIGTVASLTTTATFAGTSTVGATTTFSIGSQTVTFASGTTIDAIITAINSNTALHATATLNADGTFVLSSSDLSNASVSIDDGASGFAGTAVNESSVVADGAYSSEGNTVTVQSGDAKGLSFTINSGATSQAGGLTVDANGGLNLQIGANQGQTMYVSISDMRAKALGVDGIDVSTAANAESAITTLQNAINQVSSERSKLGAYQNRLDHTINNLSTQSQNLSSASSQITDVDMAKEMTEFTKDNILTQAAQSMLAQANQLPQGVLSLLK